MASPPVKKRRVDSVAADVPKKRRTLEETPFEDQQSDADSADSEEAFEDDGEATVEATDSYERHFASPDLSAVKERLNAFQNGDVAKKTTIIESVGKAQIYTAVDQSYHLPEHRLTPADMQLKQRLRETKIKFDDEQSALAAPMTNYMDLFYAGRTPKNISKIRDVTSLHILNHIYKTRDRVLKNNDRLARDSSGDLELRDQGYTRPKVLFLVPTRQACAKWLEKIAAHASIEQQENKQRFTDLFSAEEGRFSEDRPADFQELFDGNADDNFRIGIKFTRKTMKYYSSFYNSDIIFASPLGLRRAMKLDDAKKADCDFLSSIEILVMDQAGALLYQSWDHVDHALSHLNLPIKKDHGCDWSRVRQTYLNGYAPNLRQTIMYSSYVTPQLNHIFEEYMKNVAGRVRIHPQFDDFPLRAPTVRQTFVRFNYKSPVDEPDERWNFFVRTTLEPLCKEIGYWPEGKQGVLIYAPSRVDFLRIRYYLKFDPAPDNVSFGEISEYTKDSDNKRARTFFASGRHNLLLYSGRAHHFRRYNLRGVKSVIFYGVPEDPVHYTELAGDTITRTIKQDDGAWAEYAYVKTLFSGLDLWRMAPIVGDKRVRQMTKEGAPDTFDFR